jgi:hypothetical protein
MTLPVASARPAMSKATIDFAAMRQPSISSAEFTRPSESARRSVME